MNTHHTTPRRVARLTLLAAVFATGLARAEAPDAGLASLDALETSLAAGDSPALRQQRAEQAQAMNRDNGRHLDRDRATRSGATIYLAHNRSLIEELFYQLEAVAPYAELERSLYLDKLRALKANQDRLHAGEITEPEFQREAAHLEQASQQERQQATDYLTAKHDRILGICTNLDDNLQAIGENLHPGGAGAIPSELAGPLLALRGRPAWRDWSGHSARGEDMRKALAQVPDANSARIGSCLDGLFSAYLPRAGGPLIPLDIAAAVAGQFGQ